MDDRITIIEGPPPVFEAIGDGWALGLTETSQFAVPALTRLRTFNGAQLVERCYRAWHTRMPIHLHYRNEMGLEEKAPILAARTVKTEEGDVLLLWVYLDAEKAALEFGSGGGEGADRGGE